MLELPFWGTEELSLVARYRSHSGEAPVEDSLKHAIIYMHAKAVLFFQNWKGLDLPYFKRELGKLIHDYPFTEKSPLMSFLLRAVYTFQQRTSDCLPKITIAAELLNLLDSIHILSRHFAAYLELSPFLEPAFKERAEQLCSDAFQVDLEHATAEEDELALTPEWLPDSIPVQLVRYPKLLRLCRSYVLCHRNYDVLGSRFNLSISFELGPRIASLQPVQDILIPFMESSKHNNKVTM